MIKVNGEKHPWREGMTLADLLNDLGDPFSYAVARINKKQVSAPHFEKSVIPDDSNIFLIPMIAGG